MSLLFATPEAKGAYLERACEDCKRGPVRWSFVPSPTERPRGPGAGICEACGHEAYAWPHRQTPRRMVGRSFRKAIRRRS